jgi:hypothetical protein
MQDIRAPARYVFKGICVFPARSPKLKREAPRIAGMERRKEYLAAVS